MNEENEINTNEGLELTLNLPTSKDKGFMRFFDRALRLQDSLSGEFSIKSWDEMLEFVESVMVEDGERTKRDILLDLGWDDFQSLMPQIMEAVNPKKAQDSQATQAT